MLVVGVNAVTNASDRYRGKKNDLARLLRKSSRCSCRASTCLDASFEFILWHALRGPLFFNAITFAPWSKLCTAYRCPFSRRAHSPGTMVSSKLPIELRSYSRSSKYGAHRVTSVFPRTEAQRLETGSLNLFAALARLLCQFHFF